MIKKLLTLAGLATFALNAMAQTNTSPWSSTGSVGIGTTTPGAPLSIYSTTEGTATSVLRINSGTGAVLNSGGAIEFYKAKESYPMGRIYTLNQFSGASSSIGKLTLGSYDGTAYMDELTLFGGSVGIGTKTPQGALQVLANTSAYDNASLLYLTNNATDYGRTNLVLTGRLEAGNDAWAFGTSARNSIVFAENISTTGANIGAIGTSEYSVQLEGNSKSLGFLSATNAANPNMVLTQSGNVGIGTANPQSLLAVAGTMTAKQVTVTQTGWSDFVFDSLYQKMSLNNVAAYIHLNKHLPEIPSAAELEKVGLDLGAMQKLHMQKIEELTLYAIDADQHAKQQDTLIAQQQTLLLQFQAQLKAQQEQLQSQQQEIRQLKQQIQGH